MKKATDQFGKVSNSKKALTKEDELFAVEFLIEFLKRSDWVLNKKEENVLKEFWVMQKNPEKAVKELVKSSERFRRLYVSLLVSKMKKGKEIFLCRNEDEKIEIWNWLADWFEWYDELKRVKDWKRKAVKGKDKGTLEKFCQDFEKKWNFREKEGIPERWRERIYGYGRDRSAVISALISVLKNEEGNVLRIALKTTEAIDESTFSEVSLCVVDDEDGRMWSVDNGAAYSDFLSAVQLEWEVIRPAIKVFEKYQRRHATMRL